MPPTFRTFERSDVYVSPIFDLSVDRTNFRVQVGTVVKKQLHDFDEAVHQRGVGLTAVVFCPAKASHEQRVVIVLRQRQSEVSGRDGKWHEAKQGVPGSHCS